MIKYCWGCGQSTVHAHGCRTKHTGAIHFDKLEIEQTALDQREFLRCSQLMGQYTHAIFVFGSNEAGAHGAGAAAAALKYFGAVLGQGVGLFGRSYAVPTKDHKVITLPLADVERYVGQFLEFALAHPELLFVVTRIGCGLAGFTDADIAPLFASAPSNCRLPEGWRDPIVEQVLAKLSGDYTDAPDVDDHIMTIDEFKAACSSGGFIDYDGHGAPMLGGLVNPNVTIYPSTVDDDIPDGATHIVWYNR